MRKKHILKLALVLLPLIGAAKVMRFRARKFGSGTPGHHRPPWAGPHHHGFRAGCRENPIEPNIQHA